MRGTYHVVRCIGGGGVGGVSAVRFTLQVQLVPEAGLRDVALQHRVNTVKRRHLYTGQLHVTALFVHTPTTPNGITYLKNEV